MKPTLSEVLVVAGLMIVVAGLLVAQVAFNAFRPSSLTPGMCAYYGEPCYGVDESVPGALVILGTALLMAGFVWPEKRTTP